MERLLDYRDFYRFLASVGIVLIGAGLLLPYLWVEESQVDKIGVEEYSRLVPGARRVIDVKYRWIEKWVMATPYVSGSFVVAGFVVLIVGLRSWHKRQRVRDQVEDIDLRHREAQLTELTEHQKLTKVLAEVSEASPDRTSAPAEGAGLLSGVMHYLSIEDTVASALKRQLQGRTILRNVELENTQFDIVVRAAANAAEDAVVEIKFLPSTLGSVDRMVRRVKDAITQHSVRTQFYRERLRRRARALLLVVAGRGTDVAALRASLEQRAPDRGDQPVEVRVVGEDDLDTFDYVGLLGR